MLVGKSHRHQERGSFCVPRWLCSWELQQGAERATSAGLGGETLSCSRVDLSRKWGKTQ